MIGIRLAQYEITDHLGTGGMGEVYQATDSRLGRIVAIKLLPEAFTHDAERAARFDREARILASLNHPNIASIHGLEEAAGRKFLVMELAHGETMAQRIARGAMPIDESLATATQICEALEAAHERGIIHRDLKPANIKVSPNGVVKVLDFGLAKAFAQNSENLDMSNSPTLSMAATRVGVILGTAAYMSPEQARGKVVDQRTDIFAFGCVLYEMLTARQAFGGEDFVEIVSRVLKQEPDWTLLPANLPRAIQQLLRLCLQKDAKKRRQTATDVKIDIAEASAEPPFETGEGYFRIGGLTLTIVPPSGMNLNAVGNLSSAPEISPNGTAVMFRAEAELYVRRLNSIVPQRVEGSETGANAAFWSADSTSVVYPSNSGRLMKVHMPNGPPQEISQRFGPSRGGTWSDNGTILIAHGDLFAVPASGGEVRQVEMPGMRAGICLNPEFLPGSEDFLFIFVPDDNPEEGEVYLATLRGDRAVDPLLLLRNPTAAHFTPAGGGRILFVRADNLYAQKLNRSTRKLEGQAELITQGVASQPSMMVNRGEFSVARNGTVAWRPGTAALAQVTIFDRQGNQVDTAGSPGSMADLVLSPSEKQVLTSSYYRSWLLDVGQPGRLALNADALWFGWSPDGTRLFGINRSFAFVEMSVGGSGEVSELANSCRLGKNLFINDISPDGKFVLVQVGGGRGILAVQLQGSVEETSPRALVPTDYIAVGPRFSPDGRWIVYTAGDSDYWTRGIYVQPFPGPGQRRQIAPVGRLPVWRKDGKEILYINSEGLMSVEVETTGNDIRSGVPLRLFSGLRAPAGSVAISRPLEVSADGSRIYWTQAVQQPDSNMIHVKMGWLT